ncbi:hypothetical protein ACIA74_23335 [Streptomyces sp. NPDC051658]|uniref:hypothetical protein n=1 Tax=Streptomyces sp. NPDC051658 TaxID=3365667 RepID=UPI003789A85D
MLPTPKHFEQTSELVTEGIVPDHVVCGDDVDEHVWAVCAHVEANFDEAHVNQVGPQQQGFFDLYGTSILPQFRDGCRLIHGLPLPITTCTTGHSMSRSKRKLTSHRYRTPDC